MDKSTAKTALDLEQNIGALVCYLNICVPIGLIYSIIVLVQDKTNKLPRFHAFQSIIATVLIFVLYIGWVVVAVIGAVVDAAIGLPVISGLGTLIVGLLGLGVFALIIFSAVKAYQGEIFKIPIVGNMADKWSG